jgi:PAS domain S-box-containing protein
MTTVRVDWFVPVLDVTSALLLGVVALMGAMDAVLRREVIGLPIAAAATATGVLWLAHMVVFPGVLHFGLPGAGSQTPIAVFSLTSIASPTLLIGALLARPRPLAHPGRAVVLTLGAAVAGALGLAVAAVAASSHLPAMIAAGERFTTFTQLLWLAGLGASLAAIGLFASGKRGDARVSNMVMTALLLIAFGAIDQVLFVHGRYQARWYVAMVLRVLPDVALLAAMCRLFVQSVKNEQHRTSDLRVLEQTALALAARPDRLSIQLEVVAAVRDALTKRSDHGHPEVSLFEVHKGWATLVAEQHLAGKVDVTPFPLELDPLLERALAHGRPELFLVEELQTNQRLDNGNLDDQARAEQRVAHRALAERGLCAWVCMPIVFEDELLGALTVASSTPGALDADAVQLIEGIAHLAGLAIARADIYDRVAAIVHSITEGVITVDEAGAIESVNPVASGILREPVAALVGRPVELVADPTSRGTLGSLLENCRAGGVNTASIEMAGHRSGGAFPLEATAAPLQLGSRRLVLLVIRDLTEKRAAEETLRSSEARGRAIIQAASEAFVEIDGDGIVTRWNDHAEQLFGWPEAEAVGAVLAERILPLRYRQAHKKGIAEYLRTGKSQLLNQWIEISAITRTGREIPVELSIWPVESPTGTSFCAFVRDISERKAAERALRQANQDLARSNADLSEFASVAAHDLKSPLSNIGGFAGMLAEGMGGDLTAEGREYTGYIARGVSRMTELIDDLLSYARLGSAAMAWEPVDCQRLVAEILVDLGGTIAARGATVQAEGLPVVTGDSARLRQLFQNLLTNALKFAAADTVPVVQVKADHLDADWVISVTDNGIGIDERHRDRVFRMFQRLHSDEYDGTGMGLALCKRVAEAHGGRIWVEQPPEPGTSICVALPRQPITAADQSSEAHHAG